MNTILFRLLAMLLIYGLLKYVGGSFGHLVLYPVTLLVTFLHEFGHALGALLTGGTVEGMQINPDGSGYTITRGGNQGVVLMGGYLGSAVLGNLLFYIGARKRPQAQTALMALAVLMALSGLIWFQSLVSTGLLLGFAVVLYFIAAKTNWEQDMLMFLGLAAVLYIIQDFNVGPKSDLAMYEQVVGILPSEFWMFVWLGLAGFFVFPQFAPYFQKPQKPWLMIRRISLTRFSHFIIGYMVLAFGWWSYHLWCQNDRLYAVEKQLLAVSPAQQAAPEAGVRLTKQWQSRRRMVVAEGLFFTLCLAIGLYIINRSANRAVALARQRRNFMLSITHELKSPIAGMRLVLETLGKRELAREQLEKLCAIGVRDASRLQNLVEDLLLAARLEDNWKPHIEPVDLAALAREGVSSLQVRFPAARFHLQIPADLPPMLADKPGLGSVLHNLLENAVKYAPEGSTVILSAEHAHGKTILQVKDQGQGIPDGEKTAVFEKFYRVGNEETRKTSGTGLGLYIVQQVVRAHGGTIVIKDNVPRGTVFVVEI